MRVEVDLDDLIELRAAAASAEDHEHTAEVGRRLYQTMSGNHVELIQRVDSLFDRIKHGDEEHQEWLKSTIKEHFKGLV